MFGKVLSVQVVSFNVSSNLSLPLVSIVQQLLLVVEQLLVGLGGELEVGPLHDGVNRAGLLAEATEDALGHVDVVLGRTARAIRSRLTLNLDGKGRTGSFAKFASDTSLFPRGIPCFINMLIMKTTDARWELSNKYFAAN